LPLLYSPELLFLVKDDPPIPSLLVIFHSHNDQVVIIIPLLNVSVWLQVWHWFVNNVVDEASRETNQVSLIASSGRFPSSFVMMNDTGRASGDDPYWVKPESDESTPLASSAGKWEGMMG